MAFGFGFGLPRGGNTIWSPASLFAQNEPGVWYDPSDMATLFQDAAGTTPVTAVEQPVGLMLDKSRGLVLGSELVTNGTFDSNISNWTSTGGSQAWSSGSLRRTSGGTSNGSYQNISVTPGRTLKISAQMALISGSGSIGVYLYDGSSFTTQIGSFISSGSIFVTPTQSTIRIYLYSDVTTVVDYDNISVRELPGVHATSLTTSRPVLTARVNQWTKTEDFADIDWSVLAATVTANAISAPDGTTSADKLVATSSTGYHAIRRGGFSVGVGVPITISIYVKTGEYSKFLITEGAFGKFSCTYDLTFGTAGTPTGSYTGLSASVQLAGNGFYRCVLSFTPNDTSLFTPSFIGYPNTGATLNNFGAQYTGDGTSGIYIWGASLTTADQASLGYQRVNTATDYNTVGFPMWLKADGVDDYMVTGTLAAPVNLNLTSTDKVTISTGVRKLSDAAAAMLVELSTNAGTVNANSFYLTAPEQTGAAGDYRFKSSGGTLNSTSVSSGVFLAPVSNVLTAAGNIAAPSQSIRVNGSLMVSGTTNQGTGNYGTYPLYQFRRAGTSLPFNGLSAGLTVVGRTLTDAELSQLETYYQQKTKAY